MRIEKKVLPWMYKKSLQAGTQLYNFNRNTSEDEKKLHKTIKQVREHTPGLIAAHIDLVCITDLP